jgi:conjugative transfer region protein (TIGR03750 family)
MDNRDDSEMLPTRLNAEPPVFRGCSISELLAIAGLSVAICVPVSILLLSFIGYAMMGIGVGSLLSIGGVVVGATMLQKMKRGRPIGYYQLQIALMFDKAGIKKLPIIKRSGHWGIGRKNNARKIQK